MQLQKQQWSVTRTLSKEKVWQISAVTFYENFNFQRDYGREVAVYAHVEPMML